MKNAIVVGAYPTSPTTEKMLVSCLEAVNLLGWDIILVTHCPVSTHIQEMVDYFIFDNENILDPPDLTPVYWYHTHDFSLSLNGQGHICTVTRNMMNGIGLADLLGYDFFFYLESDNIFAETDIAKLSRLMETVQEEEKQLLLFDVGDERYESLMFGGRPSYFLKNMPSLRDESDLRRHKVHLTLEQIFYNYLNGKKDECTIINSASYDYFKDSRINIIANHCRVEVIRSNTGEYFLWASNSADNKSDVFISLYSDIDTICLKPNGFFFQKVNPDDVVRVLIWEIDSRSEKVFFLTENNLKQIDTLGELTFRTT